MENIIDLIGSFEDNSIKIKDLDRAIKYNWLRNSLLSSQIDEEKALDTLVQIHYNLTSVEVRFNNGTL